MRSFQPFQSVMDAKAMRLKSQTMASRMPSGCVSTALVETTLVRERTHHNTLNLT